MAAISVLGIDGEAARLARLYEYAILDTEAEQLFDTVTKLAAIVCDMPIAMVSLIDADRQWFKSCVGLEGASETPRHQAFCAHTILQADILEVPDATTDPRFADNPLVLSAPAIRFYAGAPLIVTDGIALGSLCVIDRKPGKLTEHQQVLLKELATIVVQALEYRRQRLEAGKRTEKSQERLERLYAATPAMMYSLNINGRLLTVSDAWLAALGYTRAEVMGRPIHDFFTPEPIPDPGGPDETRHDQHDVERQMRRKDGTLIDVLVSAITEDDPNNAGRVLAVVTNLSGQKEFRRPAPVAPERRYAALLDEQTEMVALVAADGTLRYANSAYAKFFCDNADPESLIGTSIFDFVPPDSRSASEQRIQRTLDSVIPVKAEIRYPGPGGMPRWVEWRSRSFPDSADAGTLALFVGHDITENREALTALRAGRRFLRGIGEAAGIGGWEIDIPSGTVTWTDEIRRIHDAAEDFVPTLESALAFYSPQSRLVARNAVAQALQHGTPFDLDLRVVTAKERSLWVRSAGHVESRDGNRARLVGTIQDITRRKELELESSKNRHLLAATLDLVGDAVISTDAHGAVVQLNRAAERFTGWTEDEARGRPLEQVFVSCDTDMKERLGRTIAACLADRGAGAVRHRTRMFSRTGAAYEIEASASAIHDDAGAVEGAVLVCREVWEERHQHLDQSAA